MNGFLPSLDRGETIEAQRLYARPDEHRRIAMLVDTGVLELSSDVYRRAHDLPAGVLSLFAPLISGFDITLKPVRLPDCPVHFCTGIVRVETGAGSSPLAETVAVPAGGQGATAARAAIGCLGEMAERISLFRAPGADPRVRTLSSDAPDFPLGTFLGLSKDQERQRLNTVAKRTAGQPHGKSGWNAVSDSRVRIESLDGDAAALLPALGVLINGAGPAEATGSGLVTSSGMAVWRDVEGATQRALLELVERDAMAQAWYNRLGTTLIESQFVHRICADSLVRFLTGRARATSFFRIDTDLPVHVAAAVSHKGDGFAAAVGVSAAFNIGDACESAAHEMLQNEISLELMERAYPLSGHEKAVDEAPRRIPSALRYARETSIMDDLRLDAAALSPQGELERRYAPNGLLEALGARGFDIWKFDATRADLNIPCIKLLSTDLCGWEPRFGKRRLYNGVVERGLAQAPLTEADFAARPFPF